MGKVRMRYGQCVCVSRVFLKEVHQASGESRVLRMNLASAAGIRPFRLVVETSGGGGIILREAGTGIY